MFGTAERPRCGPLAGHRVGRENADSPSHGAPWQAGNRCLSPLRRRRSYPQALREEVFIRSVFWVDPELDDPPVAKVEESFEDGVVGYPVPGFRR